MLEMYQSFNRLLLLSFIRSPGTQSGHQFDIDVSKGGAATAVLYLAGSEIIDESCQYNNRV